MKKLILIPATMLILLAACNRSNKTGLPSDESPVNAITISAPQEVAYDKKESQANYDQSVAFSEPEVQGEQIHQKTEKQKQMLLKDGRLTIRTEHLEESKQAIDRQLKKANAYYESEVLVRDETNNHYELNIRVPAANFEKLLRGLENGKDKLENKSIQATDVTEEYVDAKLRLSNKRTYLERYKELVSKAKSVKELLEIEEIIRNLQEEIESREGRIRFLEDQAAFSSLSIKLYTQEEVVTEKMGDSLETGWSGVVSFFLWLLKIWPLLVVLGIASWFARRYWKKSRKA